MNFTIKNCHSKCYDSAANMAGSEYVAARYDQIP